MRIPSAEIERVFLKVANVRAHLRRRALEGIQLQLDWRTLADVVADMYALKISVFEVTASGTTVAGFVERYADYATIMVRSSQTEDMLRFVTVKELCHLIIDENEDWSNDGLRTIRETKLDIDLTSINGDGVTDPSRVQMSETLAIFAAVALMYPCEFHAADIEKVTSGQKTVARIALEHGVPGWLVEFAFNNEKIFAYYTDEIIG